MIVLPGRACPSGLALRELRDQLSALGLEESPNYRKVVWPHVVREDDRFFPVMEEPVVPEFLPAALLRDALRVGELVLSVNGEELRLPVEILSR